jgi:hypothetical protein
MSLKRNKKYVKQFTRLATGTRIYTDIHRYRSWSENLNDGQVIRGVRIESPLKAVNRIIYQAIGKVVVIHDITDGRRNLRETMRQRILISSNGKFENKQPQDLVYTVYNLFLYNGFPTRIGSSFQRGI